MKKSISIILALIMTLSCMTTLALPTFATGTAPVGTGIDSLDDITDLTADYYLTSAIGTADVPNATTISDAFTGTLDGNGKTIYTSVPVFATLGEGAEVKNLTLDGAITAANENTGALVKDVTGSITLTSVTNNVDITMTQGASKIGVGGIIGAVGNVAAGGTTAADTDLCTLTMTNCVNNGDVTIATTLGWMCAGGLVGAVRCRVVAMDCVNNGELTDTDTTNQQVRIGGIVGQTIYVNTSSVSSLEDSVYIRCINTGNISNLNTNHVIVGGIISAMTMQGKVIFDSCNNSGEIYGVDKTNGKAGGIVGACDNSNINLLLVNCVNDAKVETAVCGGMIGRTKSSIEMKGCVNNGDVGENSGSNTVYAGGMIGQHEKTGAATELYTFEGCVNNGDIPVPSTAGTQLLGGMVGYAQATAGYVFINCVNNGDITVVTDAGGNKTAGFVAVRENGTTTFIGCVNNGDVEGYRVAGGFGGDFRTSAKLVACVNTGTITLKPTVFNGNAFAGGMIAFASYNAAATYNLYNCVNYGDVINANGTEDGKTYTNKNGTMSAMLSMLHTNGTAYMAYCENLGTVTGDAKLVGFLGTTENCIDRATLDDTTAAVEFEGIQRSVAVENETTFDVRFITSVTDIDNYLTTGILVYVAESGSSNVRFTDVDTDTVYTQISGSEDGVNVVYPETAVEGKYFTALTVTDISVEGTYTFIVVPYTVALDGKTVAYGEAYTTVITDGVITACYNLANGAN